MPGTSSRQASMTMLTDGIHISQDMLMATVPYIAFQCMGVWNHMESRPYTSSATRNTLAKVLCKTSPWKIGIKSV